MFVFRIASTFSLPSRASSSSPEMILLSPGMSAMVNNASTVCGSSPEITLTSIPFSRKMPRVSRQSGRTSSSMAITATTVRSGM